MNANAIKDLHYAFFDRRNIKVIFTIPIKNVTQ